MVIVIVEDVGDADDCTDCLLLDRECTEDSVEVIRIVVGVLDVLFPLSIKLFDVDVEGDVVVGGSGGKNLPFCIFELSFNGLVVDAKLLLLVLLLLLRELFSFSSSFWRLL